MMDYVTKRRNAERLARQEIADLPNELVEPVLVRAIGKPIVYWTMATADELERIYATARRASLVFGAGA